MKLFQLAGFFCVILLIISWLPVFSAFCRRNQYVVVDGMCQISNILSAQMITYQLEA